jgi:hypothetical protein
LVLRPKVAFIDQSKHLLALVIKMIESNYELLSNVVYEKN